MALSNSLLEQLQQVQNFTDVDIIKKKRTIQRAQFTRIFHKFEKYKDKPLQNFRAVDLTRILDELKPHAILHDALQDRYDEVLVEIPSLSEVSAEREEDEARRQDHQDAIFNIEEMITKMNYYQEGVILLQTLKEVSKSGNLLASSVVSKITRLDSQIELYLKSTLDYIYDEDINSMCTELQQDMLHITRSLAQAQESSSTSSMTTIATKPEIVVNSRTSRLKVSLPKYDGSPLEWRRFLELFTTVIEKDSTLRDSEKTCLLLESMDTPETKEVVKAASVGCNSYNTAIKALQKKYGRPRTIANEHLKFLTKRSTFGYNRKDLTYIYETWSTHIHGLKDISAYETSNILAMMLESQFDRELAHEWALASADTDSPSSMERILDFMDARINTALPAESLKKPSTSHLSPKHIHPSQKGSRSVYKVAPTVSLTCPICVSPGHSLSKCSTFLSWDQAKKYKAVKEHNHCSNCLSHSHSHRDCTSAHNCRHCGGRHHSLLHRNKRSSRSSSPTSATVAQSSHSNTQTSSASDSENTAVLHLNTPPAALLSTAIASVKHDSCERRARVLLDSGASISLMTEKLASELKLPRYAHRLKISGITGQAVSKYFVNANLYSIYSGQSEHITVKCHVIPKLQAIIPPKRPEDLFKLTCIKGKTPLADPALGGSIDILLSIADVSRCTRGSTSLSKDRATVATLTIFGWTLGGAIPQDALPPSILRLQVNEDTLHSALQQLWELEQVPQSDVFSAADHSALQHFDDHYEVLPDGRYSVALPRVNNPPPLGDSRSMSLRRFSQNERSLIKKGKLQDFNAVMKEYLTLDRAELVPNEDLLHPPNDVFYLPIHGVFKNSSTTTKLRAVFDASASSSSGTSLNDLLLTGPNLYPLLTTILTKFRFHRIAFSADISFGK